MLPMYVRLGSFCLFLIGLVFACAPVNNNNNNNTTGCKDDSICKKSERCQTSNGKCVPIICEKKEDCRESYHCNLKTQRCQEEPYSGCSADSQCPSGQKCTQGACVATSNVCSQDRDCKDAKLVCQSGQCVEKPKPECTQDSDCKEPKPVCKAEKCVDKSQVECTQDSDCLDPSKRYCVKNVCASQKVECATSADCKDPTKPICVGQICRRDDSKEGEPCEDGKQACKSDLTCHKEDPQKPTGICRRSCLVFTPQCSAPKVCQQIKDNNGICVDPNNGKKATESCETEACEKNLTCVVWREKKICAAPCSTSSANCAAQQECYEFQPDLRYCVPEREPCGPGRGCTDPKDVCESGRCTPPKGCQGVQCKSEEVCENGACRKKRCPAEITCTSEQTCNNGICEGVAQDPPCVSCGSGQSCPKTTDRCLSGGGLSDIPGDSFCISSCATDPCADSKNFHCVTINIGYTNTCSTTTDCNNPSLKCVNGKCTEVGVRLCMPIIGTCRNKCKAKTCQSGQSCIPSTGACVSTGKQICEACTVNEECGGKNLCISFSGSSSSFCGQDCSGTNTCPTGFNCVTLSDGINKQCAPPNATQCPKSP